MYKQPTIKQTLEWTASLRSGKYKQGAGELMDSKNNFCCLGVGCLVNDIPYDIMINMGVPDDLNYSGIPEWLKYINDDFSNKTGVSLSSLNDEGYHDEIPVVFSFDEIADLIELVYVHKILD